MQPTNGVITQCVGKRMVEIMDQLDGTIHRRHMDQIHVSPSSTTATLPTVDLETSQPTNVISPAADQGTSQPTNTTSPATNLEITPPTTSEEHNSSPPTSSITSRPRRNVGRPIRYQV